MKRSIKLAVAAAVALSATSAFATNGDAMIGVGAKAIGMGGVGIGMSHGAESALINPAMITSIEGTEVSFGGTIFMPDVKTEMATGMGQYSSSADLSVIPTVAIGQKATDNFYWGVGMYGVAGMGTDYRSANGGMANMNMVTNLQLMQFAVPLAYKVDGFSIGISPILQYGSLDMNYNLATVQLMNAAAVGTRGVAQDFGFGYNIGAAYEINNLTVGASYKSAIDMKYDGQLSIAASDFSSGGLILSDHLEQPAEYGVGTSYKMGQHTFAFDYKKIRWSDAKGYKDFKWDDQNVYIFGYQFAQDNWALRAGYNYAKSPIKDQGTAGFGPLYNTLNLLGFPAIIEQHYTVGGSYNFSKMTSLDLAYVYSPEKSASMTSMVGGNITTKHSQQAATAQLNFKF